MNHSKTFCVAALIALPLVGASSSRSIAPRYRGLPVLPIAALAFPASDQGLALLKAVNHPIAAAAVRAFGEPSAGTAAPPEWFGASAPEESTAAATTCNANTGTRFNLEPRAGASPQNQGSVDFLLNRLGGGKDLVVGVANDWRGNLGTSVNWDQSVSGYYVHRSTAADCSVQFEGGLPSFAYQGETEFGIGNTVVAADPARDAFFIADVRFGTVTTGGVALFRASAANLLNTTTCPAGTHTEAQANSCWAATPPAFLFPAQVFDSVGDLPRVAVDERPTAVGTGAGDVYVVNSQADFNTQTLNLMLVACSNSLTCGSAINIGGNNFTTASFPDIHVRADGAITVSFLNGNPDGSAALLFLTCTPAGAPNPPVCGAPVTVTQIVHPVAPDFNILTELININLLAFTFPKHATQVQSNGSMRTFLVYDDCKNPFQYGNPPVTVCLNSEVMLTSSTNGHNWSKPASIDTSSGHHFYPAITTDSSTGTVHMAYYTTAGDFFNHSVRVFRNTIPRGGSLGTPQQLTKVPDPIDNTPAATALVQPDYSFGLRARGTGAAGQSRLYSLFDSTVVSGSYEGKPVPEMNDHVSVVSY
jgi:hypothetical protein